MRIKQENSCEIFLIIWFLQGSLFEPTRYMNDADDAHKLHDAYGENGCRLSYDFMHQFGWL